MRRSRSRTSRPKARSARRDLALGSPRRRRGRDDPADERPPHRPGGRGDAHGHPAAPRDALHRPAGPRERDRVRAPLRQWPALRAGLLRGLPRGRARGLAVWSRARGRARLARRRGAADRAAAGGASAHGNALDGCRKGAVAGGAGLPVAELRPPDRALDARRPRGVRRDRRRVRHRPVLGLLDLEPEAGELFRDRPVEGGLVLLRGVLVERRGEVVPQPREDLGAVLDQLLIVPEQLFAGTALGAVVGALGLVAGLEQLEVVAHEQVELPRDQVGEAAPAHVHRLVRPVSLLVRTWNVFHGNASPPERRGFLEQMIRLATEDQPDVLCLQELPVWALKRLGDWSGMQVHGAVAARPLLRSVAPGRLTTALHQGVFRSAVSGQANAILLRPDLRVLGEESTVLNPLELRRRVSRELHLSRRMRARWAKERRVCQAVRLEGLTVANLHATGLPGWLVADAELRRAAEFAERVAAPGDVLVLAGDFNIIRERSTTLPELVERGFSKPIEWIDQTLVRGAQAGPAHRWPDERRRVAGRLLSDHAPVEVTIE